MIDPPEHSLKKDLLFFAGAAAVLALYLFFACSTARRTSVTVDEFARIPAAASYLKTGDLRIEKLSSPPLLRCLLGLPQMGLNPKIPRGAGWRNSNMWYYGWEYMAANHDRYLALVWRARLAVIVTGALLGAFVFFLGYKLGGGAAGLIACAALCLDPNFIAHASIAGIDIPAAFGCALCCAALFAWAKTGRTLFACASGAAFAIALLFKFVAVLLLPLVLAAAVWAFIRDKAKLGAKRAALRTVISIFALACCAWIAVNTGYGWDSVFFRADRAEVQSRVGYAARDALPRRLAIPLPRGFVEQIDLNLHNLQHPEKRGFDFYLMGKTSPRGWMRYFLIAWLIKEPLPVILLVALGLGIALRKRQWPRLMLLLPMILFFLVFSLVLRIDTGFRYLLPGLAFQALFAGVAVSQHKKSLLAAAALCVWLAVCAARIHPNHPAYFNEFIGGPKNGHKYLIDSNLDWGQNLPALKDYMNRNRIDRVLLANFGYADPNLYGVKHYTAPCEPARGVFAVSPQYYYNLFPFNHVSGCFDFLKDRPPDDIVAYTYFIYRFE